MTDNREAEDNGQKKFVLPWEMYRLEEKVHIPDEEKIRHPAWLFLYHMAAKGYQLGAVGGLFAGVPMTWIDKSALKIQTVDRRAILQSMARYSVWCSLAGLTILGTSGIVLGWNYYDDNELNDIAFRLFHNRALRQWDACGWAGAFTGLCAGVWSVRNRSNIVPDRTQPDHHYRFLHHSRFYHVFKSTVIGTTCGMTLFALLQGQKLIEALE